MPELHPCVCRQLRVHVARVRLEHQLNVRTTTLRLIVDGDGPVL